MDVKTNRVLKIFLVLLVVLGTMPGLFANGEGKVYAAVHNFAGGTGTENDPYQIATADQLNNIRNGDIWDLFHPNR